jgi:hypothetical protein
MTTCVAAAFAACSSLSQPSETSVAPPQSSAESPHLNLVVSPQSGHWAQYRVDIDGRGLDVYVAHDSRPKPVVLLVHGSGSMMEKRGVVPLRFSDEMTQPDKLKAFERAGRECSAEYLQNVTNKARVEDVLAGQPG